MISEKYSIDPHDVKVERSQGWWNALSETVRRMTDKVYSSNLENYDKQNDRYRILEMQERVTTKMVKLFDGVDYFIVPRSEMRKLKEDNPSKIVSGFGGTFCLVISFIYIGISVILLGIGSPYGSPWQVFQSASIGQQLLFMGIFIAFSLAVGFGPLWYALRRARTFEH